MKHKKIILDIALTLLLGCQMAYSLISEVSHEITGICMFALLVLLIGAVRARADMLIPSMVLAIVILLSIRNRLEPLTTSH